jgi:hypothetical protein
MQAGEPAAPAMRYLVLGVKVVLSAALIAYAFRNIDLADASAQIHEIAGVAGAEHGRRTAPPIRHGGIRLRKVLEVVGARCGFLPGARRELSSVHSSARPSSPSGRRRHAGVATCLVRRPDQARNDGHRTRPYGGASGSLASFILTLPFLLALIQDAAMRSGLLLALAGGIAGFAFVLSIRFMPERFRQNKLIHWTYEFAAVTLVGRTESDAIGIALSRCP